ncbi:MAG: PDDEXK nuclease domain-containing protein [Paludibacter sp.]|nr:PDDEXK nuclease domain-containing protein [Paludibacter sp.]
MLDKTYKDWLIELKRTIRSTQIKASLAVNATIIQFYWDLGKMISEKQTAWGTGFLEQLSKDLKAEFPDMQGLSFRNLKYCRQFYQFYASSIGQQVVAQLENHTKAGEEKVQQAVAQLEISKQATDKISQQTTDVNWQQLVAKIPWGHNILIFSKSDDVLEAGFYIQKTIENGWSRAVLSLQIESGLYSRQGKAITNFKNTLPDVSSDLAHQLLKDPYQFDFLTLTENYRERELENALVENITRFLLELGSGFAYVGRQVPLKIGEKEFAIDLLFYHLKLRAYVVIELKATEFEPEFAGKLSFYLSAANDLLKHPTDNPTIGLMICKTKNDIIVEYALKNINQPIGISEYELTKQFPEQFRSSLPTIEEIENELKDRELNDLTN